MNGANPVPPLLRLPSEIILKILGSVAQLGDPTLLPRCAQTCRAIRKLLDDSLATDVTIHKAGVEAFLGAFTPTEIRTERWRQLLMRSSKLARSGFTTLAPGEKVYTGYNGQFPPPKEFVPPVPANEPNIVVAPNAFPGLPEGATREICALHTCTEESRIRSELPYLSVRGSYTMFGDAPLIEDADLLRAKVTPEGLVLEEKDANSREKLQIYELWTMQWIKMSLHSDPDLQLRPVREEPNEADDEVPKPMVGSVTRVSDGTEWNLRSLTGWDDLSLNEKRDNDPFHVLGMDTTWEFRSAGEYLAICDDNNGFRPSTITVFKAGCDKPHWQKLMVGVDSGEVSFFYDNDGIQMNSSVVVYATRNMKYNPRRGRGNWVCMEFHCLSVKTGETIRVLKLEQERREQLDRLDFWCNFSVSDMQLAATIGGNLRNEQVHSNDRYGYRKTFVWNLTSAASEHPGFTVEFPRVWEPDQNTYCSFSPDGCQLIVTQDWQAAVYDLQEKRLVSVWDVETSELWEKQNDFMQIDPRRRNDFWNGLWVSYRDVKDDGSTTSGMVFLPARFIRRTLGGHPTQSPTPSEMDELDDPLGMLDDSDDDDDDDDDDDGGLYFYDEHTWEDMYEQMEDFVDDFEAMIPHLEMGDFDGYEEMPELEAVDDDEDMPELEPVDEEWSGEVQEGMWEDMEGWGDEEEGLENLEVEGLPAMPLD